jgi:hypothetical protein
MRHYPQDSAVCRRRQKPMAASGEGETRSVYVVQRHFRRVQRGHDPVEVDRHLQLVSEWFRQSRAGETARELEKQWQAREREVSEGEERARRLLESKRLEAEATLGGARLRVKADTEAAERVLREAEAATEQRPYGGRRTARAGARGRRAALRRGARGTLRDP